jgi:hypothetical protein
LNGLKKHEYEKIRDFQDLKLKYLKNIITTCECVLEMYELCLNLDIHMEVINGDVKWVSKAVLHNDITINCTQPTLDKTAESLLTLIIDAYGHKTYYRMRIKK